jgi:hypothetical protein
MDQGLDTTESYLSASDVTACEKEDSMFRRKDPNLTYISQSSLNMALLLD